MPVTAAAVHRMLARIGHTEQHSDGRQAEELGTVSACVVGFLRYVISYLAATTTQELAPTLPAVCARAVPNSLRCL